MDPVQRKQQAVLTDQRLSGRAPGAAEHADGQSCLSHTRSLCDGGHPGEGGSGQRSR